MVLSYLLFELSHCHMKTALFHLIFDITTLLNTHITKHFREDPFEGVVPNLAS